MSIMGKLRIFVNKITEKKLKQALRLKLIRTNSREGKVGG